MKKISFSLLLCFIIGYFQYVFAQSPGGVNPGGALKLWLKADAQIMANNTQITNANKWIATVGANTGGAGLGNAGTFLGAGIGANVPVFYNNSAAGQNWNFNPLVHFLFGGIGGIYNNTGSSLTTFAVSNYQYNQNGDNLSGFNGEMRTFVMAGATPSADQDNSPAGSLCTIGGAPMRANAHGSTAVTYVANALNGANPGISNFVKAGGSANTGNSPNTVYAVWNGKVANSAASTGTFAITYYTLGGYATGGNAIAADGRWLGDLPEVIAYNTDLSIVQRQLVNSYLAVKYGLTLDQSTPLNYLASDSSIIWNGSANSSYKNNIAGIGRDDNSALNQKQSKSINSNSNGQITMGLGNIATLNSTNSNSFTNNKSFLIWSDNGNTQSLSTANTSFTYNGFSNNVRMNRVWLVQNTGVSQSVAIQFPTASVGTSATPSGTCAQYAIIYSSDPTFATGVTATVLTTSGSNYIANHKFPQGTTYFTFAKITQQAPGTAYLPLINSTASNNSPCTNAPGWKYYYYDAGLTQKAFAINWNGNAEPGGVNCVTTYSATPYTKTSGSYQCNIMGRTIEVLPAGGSYTINGGVQIKIFFDSTELNNSLVAGAISQRWLKISGNAGALVAANNGQQIPGATYFTPAASGEEDGVDYVQLNNITSFSTFGFASNTGQNPLPVDLISFTGIKKGTNQVSLNWTVENEYRFDRYEVEQSLDGIQYTKAATVKALSNGARATYTTDVQFSAPVSYYRLRMIDNNGSYKYSSVIVIKSRTEGEQKLVLLPNPVKGDKVMVQLSGYRGISSIKVYDQYGRLVLPSVTVNGSGTTTLNVSGLSSGTYYIRAVDSNDGGNTQKLLLIH